MSSPSVVLSAPTAFGTNIGTGDFADDHIVHQALRTDVEWLVAHRTDGSVIEVSDTGDCSA